MRWFSRSAASSHSAEVLPSPNIWYYQRAYELENRAQDAGGEIWRALREECEWAGRDVLDIGCGDGFHLPYFAREARSVLGVEPHAPLARDAAKRVAELPNVSVKEGRAQRLPVADASVDVVHARTAYFFGPGCEPGLREAERVLRPGGSIVIVDLDATSEPYGGWMRADLPHYDPVAVERFFAAEGFRLRRVATRWQFADHASLESVLKIEFSPKVAERAVAEVLRGTGSGLAAGVTLPVGYRVHTRGKPTGLVLPGHSAVSGEPSSAESSSTSPRIV
ncbi:class I SAM-dependent methyltransferase [Amycolatopsis sp. FDAARGOS 1241]|uniref:class I SAM-dependent methyltransferase n=1 Tax=Amycolatopsis sp. FDAARGOS 1241 TaxID=2778070 RepID=UPI0019521EC6|nr:class I SAM-dependent methyltransferase [Amycolatopsis sp. FDAARGOS 1241]QRP44326.1 class I SAM-dependent methyltransferase [Amycolatopsis sp. FDAARGOS 1241]